jgi:hypothetical protein
VLLRGRGVEVADGVLRCPAFGDGGEDLALLRRWVRKALLDRAASGPHCGNIARDGVRACDVSHSGLALVLPAAGRATNVGGGTEIRKPDA